MVAQPLKKETEKETGIINQSASGETKNIHTQIILLTQSLQKQRFKRIEQKAVNKEKKRYTLRLLRFDVCFDHEWPALFVHDEI